MNTNSSGTDTKINSLLDLMIDVPDYRNNEGFKELLSQVTAEQIIDFGKTFTHDKFHGTDKINLLMQTERAISGGSTCVESI